MTKKILLIGFLGYRTNQIDGQTIKTRQVLDLLSIVYPSSQILFVDTQNLTGVLAYLDLFFKVLKARKIVYLPGQRNLSKFFLPLSLMCFFTKNKIIFMAVGGWLYDFVKGRKIFKKCLNKCAAILVETSYLEKNLHAIGLKNVELFPNFRSTTQSFKIEQKKENDSFRIVFMARIMKEKGIFTLLNFEEWLAKNEPVSLENIIIDFYGPISTSDTQEFHKRIENSRICSYKGIVDPEAVFTTLNLYDVCVLPTFYKGEGAPGTIIDSYFSGIPVIVSQWKQLPEFVNIGESGYVFSLDSIDELYRLILFMYHNPDKLYKLKLGAYEHRKLYTSENALFILSKYLQK